MKRLSLIVGVVAVMSVAGLAQDPRQVFETGNQLYQQNKFPEACEAYESVLKNGYSSGELYYNLGNAYYRSGNVGRAILSYERALKIMPNDNDLRHNLELANQMITDRIEATPRLLVWDYWDSIKQALSLQSLTWLAYVLFFLTLGLFAWLLLARTYILRKVALIGGAACGVLLLVSLLVFAARMTDVNRKDAVIVVADITTVKNSPDPKSSDAFILHAGVKVQITDRLSDWVQVRLADGKVGWMEKSAAEVI